MKRKAETYTIGMGTVVERWVPAAKNISAKPNEVRCAVSPILTLADSPCVKCGGKRWVHNPECEPPWAIACPECERLAGLRGQEPLTMEEVARLHAVDCGAEE